MANFFGNLFKSKAEIAWNKAKAENTKEAYQEFIAKFPAEDMSRQAQSLLFKIEDNEEWIKTKVANTTDAYLAYYHRSKDGQHRQEARTAFEMLMDAQKQKEEEGKLAAEKHAQEDKEKKERAEKERVAQEEKNKVKAAIYQIEQAETEGEVVDIALSVKDQVVIELAFKKVTSEHLLHKLIKHNSDIVRDKPFIYQNPSQREHSLEMQLYKRRLDAIEALPDDERLYEIAIAEHSDFGVWQSVLKGMKSQDWLAKLAKNHFHEMVKEMAFKRLNNDKLKTVIYAVEEGLDEEDAEIAYEYEERISGFEGQFEAKWEVFICTDKAKARDFLEGIMKISIYEHHTKSVDTPAGRISRDSGGIFEQQNYDEKKNEAGVYVAESYLDTQLVSALIQIGRYIGFLATEKENNHHFDDKKRNIEARNIGKRFHELGGKKRMVWAHGIVKQNNGSSKASHLTYAWDGIGEWRS